MNNQYNLEGSACFVGDVHGEVYYSAKKINQFSDAAKHVIFLGDIGFGFFEDDELESTIDIHLDKSFEIWLIRGNHDDPSFWSTEKKALIGKNYPRIHMVQDGDVLIIHGKKYLVVGGGISIDQIYRTEGVSYWKDEYVRLPDKETLEDDVYGILSHSGIVPPALEGRTHPLITGGSEELKASIDRERDVFDTILKIAKPKVWFYGHYHLHNFFDYSGCKFYNLDINEVYLLSDDENR